MISVPLGSGALQTGAYGAVRDSPECGAGQRPRTARRPRERRASPVPAEVAASQKVAEDPV